MIALDDSLSPAGEIGDFPRSLVDLIGVRNALADRYAANDSARAAKHSFLERIGERGHPCRVRFAVNSPAGQKAARRPQRQHPPRHIPVWPVCRPAIIR